MTTRRDAIARNLCARLCDERRSIDELRVVDAVLSGLERGADVYGPLDLATDPRDWQMEIAEERRDELVYRSCALLSRRDERVTAPDAASVEELERGYVSSPAGTPVNTGPRPASDARELALSAPADTVVPHDGERTHGGNFDRALHAGGNAEGNQSSSASAPVTLSAAGRHGAVGEPQTSLDPGHETPTGGDSRGCSICGATSSCDCAAKVSPANWQCITCDAPVGKSCWTTPLAGNNYVANYHGARLHIAHLRANELRVIERGLRELSDATPGINSAEMWSAEMVDGRFDDSEGVE